MIRDRSSKGPALAPAKWYLQACLLIVLILALPFLFPVASAAEAPKKILIFSGVDPNLPGAVLANQALRSALEKGLPGRVEFYSEALDNSRIPEDRFGQEMIQFLQRKYEGVKIDLIVTLGSPGLKFLLKHEKEIFSVIPKIFVNTADHELDGLDLGQNVTGVQGRIELGPALDLALALQPGVRRVVVVTGNSGQDKFWEMIARNEFRSYEGRLEFRYLSNVTIEALREELASLPPHTVVLFLNFLLDAAGNAYSAPEAVSLVAPSASAPIYVSIESAFMPGVVGGRLISYDALGKAGAVLGLRVLAGERPKDILPQTLPSVAMFDWRELQRWGIDESKLPDGSIVRYKELSVWELYKWRIVGIILLSVLEALLIMGLLINMSRRRRAEEIRNRLAAIVESSEDAILSENLDGTITAWNEGATKMYGYSSTEVLGKHSSILAPAELKENLTDILARIRRQESVPHLETVRVAKDGRRIDISLTFSPIKDRNGMPIGASTIERDITDRKRADELRRQSEERFRMLADNAPVMVWISCPDALCTFFNQQWLVFTGRTMEQEIGNGWIEGIHPAHRQLCLDYYLSSFNARRTFTMEYRLRRADGQYRWLVDTGIPLFGPGGDFAGYIGSCVDISERKNHEHTLQHLTTRLFMLQDEERQRVAAELHDGLGQNLAIIKNRAQIGLRHQSSADQIREQLEEISATAMASILEVREIAHNLRPYELDRLGLGAAIESMVERVSSSTSISLSADLEPVEDQLSPDGETSVYRIVQEALNNVIKHSNATVARIEIRMSGTRMTISVQDNGKGIPEPAINGRNGGSFGLTGIAERVRGLGGFFEITSPPGGGTTLTVHLDSKGAKAR